MSNTRDADDAAIDDDVLTLRFTRRQLRQIYAALEVHGRSLVTRHLLGATELSPIILDTMEATAMSDMRDFPIGAVLRVNTKNAGGEPLRLRKAPSFPPSFWDIHISSPIGLLMNGQTLKVTGPLVPPSPSVSPVRAAMTGWFPVEVLTGQHQGWSGYVSADFVEFVSDEAAPAPREVRWFVEYVERSAYGDVLVRRECASEEEARKVRSERSPNTQYFSLPPPSIVREERLVR
jgi:hypothetical protein